VPVVATAGHVDHGKSTLVRALTGIDPDRWAAEKARGLTIDLGFAWCALPTAGDVGFVDVPGHERFIANMLAGVGAVDAALFVVAATEGWKPQSEEHLRILELLGLTRGVVALTMAAAVSGERLDLARLEVDERLAGTFLAGAEVVAVDAPAGVGLDDVVGALDRVLASAPARVDDDRPRLWVDRAFAIRGAGTVVTGTLTGGVLAVGDTLEVTPAGAPARVRALQSHERSVDRVDPGRRVAVNITGVGHDDVGRGDALVRPGQWVGATVFDCSVQTLAGLDHEVSRRGAFHAHIGTGDHAVRMRLLQRDTLAPGRVGPARVYLPRPLPVTPGDRFVLRESGRGETIGGGEILDVEPVLPASKARPDRSVDRVIAERGWVDADELYRLTGERRAPHHGHMVGSPDAVAALPVPEPATPDQDLADHPYVRALQHAPFAPPPPDGVDRRALRDLVHRGLVVERDGCYFAATAVDDAIAMIAKLLDASPDGVTVAQVRDALGTTRKHALPLLSHLDATGVTRRRGDLRVAGPRFTRT
jgi:selenocysteine-specific elongation factor